MLQSIFIQHLKHGQGVGLIEPHHDLSFDILTQLVADGFFRNNPNAFDQLVYLDWGNGSFVPFNILGESAYPKSSPDAHRRALNALEAMLRVYPELTTAPTFQTLFLAATTALIENHLPITLLYRLLTDTPFRHACLARVSDPLIQQTFANFDKLGRDQVEAAGSTLRRAFLLSYSPVARRTLGQPEKWLDFRALMDQGKSFILNLGNINEHETRKLFGALLMVEIEQAALSRTDVAPHARTPFTLLVDEWPSFASQDETIGTILSQARKFKLRMYLAAQSLAQVASNRLTGALENCRLMIAFGLGRTSAEIQAKHIGSVDPLAIKHAVADAAAVERTHPTYYPLLEQFEQWTTELQHLSPRFCYVKLHDQPAVRIKTVAVPDSRVDPDELADVLAAYQARYQRPQAEADRAICAIAQPFLPKEHEGTTPGYTTLFGKKEFSN